MSVLIDSHCHLNKLDLTPYHGDLDQVMEAARVVGVEKMLCVSIDLETFPEVLACAERYDNVYASVGVHPNDANDGTLKVDHLVSLAQHNKVIAIGETGLDYYRSEGDLTWQRDAFALHINVAKTTGKPLIIHTREAQADTIAMMQSEKANDIGGVMHCFTEDVAMAKQCLDLGFYISLSGIVTFKNAVALQEVARYVPLDRLLVETDAPYLAPTPHRGKPNYPEYVKLVAEFIAALRGESFEKIADATTENFYRLFKVG
jgi:TatD DNase family protein